jgi:hypothetical protein
MGVAMSRAPKKPAKTPSEDDVAKAPATPSKVQLQFGPTPSAPGSRLKRSKGA